MAHKEKGKWKQRLLYDAANLLLELLNDGDEKPGVEDV